MTRHDETSPADLSRAPGDAADHLILLVSELAPDGSTVSHALEASARALLAERLGVSDIAEVGTTVTVTRTALGADVDGAMTATLTQTCVVTGQPVIQVLDEPVRLHLLADLGEGAEIDVSMASPWDTEPFDGERIDITAIMEEAVALALDPYPRHPDADVADLADAASEPEDETRDNPFAVLSTLTKAGEDG